MLKNALTRLFNYELNQASPVIDDYVQVEKNDSDGVRYVVYEKFDYPKFQSSNGTVIDWSLQSLLKAGISPNFSIHTGNNTRMEGFSSILDASAVADSILAEISNSNE